MTEDDVAELGRTLRGVGVTDHVLQEVRVEGVRPEYRDLLRGQAEGSVANVDR
jgi:pyruvate formate lyase activating enzyme